MLSNLFAGRNRQDRGARTKDATSQLYQATDFKRALPLADYALEASAGMADDFSIDLRRVFSCFSFRRLQYKTQLFPGDWNDFVRNRLTHSLDVAQVAKEITYYLNNSEPFFHANPINPDLVHVAALCHDIGHPPFGHSGEAVLHEKMKDRGGFEGNAQTLRLVARLERREEPQKQDPLLAEDARRGLNLTMRTVASLIKYDNEIPSKALDGERVTKGYYDLDKKIVDQCRDAVIGKARAKHGFPTIECSIMDISDDIAYATYDLEDAFKVGILTPLSMITAPAKILEDVAERVAETLKMSVSERDVSRALRDALKSINDTGRSTNSFDAAVNVYKTSSQIALEPVHRGPFVEALQSRFKHAVRLKFNDRFPACSCVDMEGEAKFVMEVLKAFNYHSVIRSADIQRHAYKAKTIISRLFEALHEKRGLDLVPEPRRVYFQGQTGPQLDRGICDFIADMTDRYASDFFAKLSSVSPERTYHVL